MDSVPLRFIEQILAYFTIPSIEEANNVPGYYGECAHHFLEKKYRYTWVMYADVRHIMNEIIVERFSGVGVLKIDSKDTNVRHDVLNRDYPPRYCGDIVLYPNCRSEHNNTAAKEFLRRMPYTSGITVVLDVFASIHGEFIEPFIESCCITGLFVFISWGAAWTITKKLIEKKCLKNVEYREISDDENFDELLSLLVQPQFQEVAVDVNKRNLDGSVRARKICDIVQLHRDKVSGKKLRLVQLQMMDWIPDKIFAFEELKRLSKSSRRLSKDSYGFVL
ncbi:hypothetical protein QR680_011166 [Steinernema hermaphroditum]|uniref:Uncharacterized protein n=1 Tax=Steinernema hermaphroditum TaxID=289476 RepID=A0AA39MCR7_9BILA|nr:hypothetical protein QR680_011166 [Steinernema hermaphroditum]